MPRRRRTHDVDAPHDLRSLVVAVVPMTLVAVAVGVAAAMGVLALDSLLGHPLHFDGEAASALLVAAAGAMVTVTVFAVWMRTVVVGLAAARFSLRHLMRLLDDRSQLRLVAWSIGATAAVATVAEQARTTVPEQTPGLAVLFAGVLAMALVLTVLFALRLATNRLAPSEVVRRLADHIMTVIDTNRTLPDDAIVTDGGRPATVVRGEAMGWVRSIDRQAILEALPPQARCRLEVAVGGFVVPEDPIATSDVELDRHEVEQIRANIHLGRVRSYHSDLAYAFQALVDVADSAAGSSDTSTLLEVVVHLEAASTRLLDVGVASGHLCGSDGRAVVDGSRWSVADHLYVVTYRVAKAAAADPVVSGELLTSLTRLLARAEEFEESEAAHALRKVRSRFSRSLDGDVIGDRPLTTRAGNRSWV